MGDFIDHYLVVGLPSGEEAFKFSNAEITRAYRLKALDLHPDKNLDDHSNAVIAFQNLQASYEILKDENRRKVFDAALMIRIQGQSEPEERNIKKMMDDLEERNHARRMAFMKERRKKHKRMRLNFDNSRRTVSYSRMMNDLVR